MRTKASFLRYTGYLNFINGPINRVLLLIASACTTELSILFTSCLTAIKNHVVSLNIAQQFIKEMVKNYFDLLKIQVKFLIN